MNWAAIAKVFEQFLRKFFRREHGKAVDEINENRSLKLIQVQNPKSGKWKIIDREKGVIIGEGDEWLEGVTVATKSKVQEAEEDE